MSSRNVGRGMAAWLILCGIFFGFVGCSTFFQEAGKGNWDGAFGGIIFAQICWWLTTRLGAFGYNVLFAAGRVLDAQVTHADEIRRDDD